MDFRGTGFREFYPIRHVHPVSIGIRFLNSTIVIVGGGLSGLAATWQLHRHGVDVRLIEARERTGGRVLSVRVGESVFDCGPSWVWHGQPHVAGILEHFGISVYEQICDGDLLHQNAEGSIRRDSVLKPMEGALRVCGGVAAIADAMRAELPNGIVHCGAVVTSLVAGDDCVTVSTDDGRKFQAQRVALALPLRLAAGLRFEPALDEPSIKLLESTPTWMSGQAKVFAFYDKPFWRDQGLSGDVFSRSGPLAEVHEATTEAGGPFALMGFVGIDGPARDALTKPKLIEAAKAQLAELFGEQAATPIDMRLMDWSTEPYTAAPTDRRAPSHHPQYGIQVPLASPWSDSIHRLRNRSRKRRACGRSVATGLGLRLRNHSNAG